MSEKYAVAVIIPVYNSANYLEECLNSVVRQTLGNIQIICINDGSTDNSKSILTKFQKEHSRNILVIHTTNGGASVARNLGLRIARAEYISFIDSDDTIPKDYLSTLYNEARTFKADIVMTSTNFINYSNILYTQYIPGIYSTFIEKCSTLPNGAVWDKLFKSNLIYDNNIKFLENRMYEDNLFSIQALYYSKKMKVINSPRYNYRMNASSVTKNPTLNDKRKEDAIHIYQQIMAFAMNNNFTEEELRVVNSFLRNRSLPEFFS